MYLIATVLTLACLLCWIVARIRRGPVSRERLSPAPPDPDMHLREASFSMIDELALPPEIYDGLTSQAGQPSFMMERPSAFFTGTSTPLIGVGADGGVAEMVRRAFAPYGDYRVRLSLSQAGTTKLLIHRDSKMYGVLLRIDVDVHGVVRSVAVIGFVPEDRIYTFMPYNLSPSDDSRPFPVSAPTDHSILPDDAVTTRLLCDRIKDLKAATGLDASYSTLTC